MRRIVEAEYDAQRKTLRLDQPLDGVDDHQRVHLIISDSSVNPERPWMALHGSLAGEAGDELAQLVEEMFPIERE
jgi:hypothetical protein